MVISYFDFPIDYQFLVQRDSPVFCISHLCQVVFRVSNLPSAHSPSPSPTISTWGFSYSYEPWFMINRRDPALVSMTIHVPILTNANSTDDTDDSSKNAAFNTPD
jgi:hypothetical protein